MTVMVEKPHTTPAEADVVSNNTETLLTKVRLIFEAFEGERRRLTLTEISHRSSLAKSTVHRLATELVEHGYLDRSENSYQLGTRLFWLGQRVPVHEELRQIALPHLVTLFRAMNEPVYLSQLGRREVLYLEKLIGSHGMGSVHRISTRGPLHATASGKVLMAYTQPSPFDDLNPLKLRRFTPHTIDNPTALREAIAETRRRGYGVTREELVTGYGSVAVPLLSSTRELIGAIAVAPPMSSLSVNRILPLLQVAARRIVMQFERHVAL